MNVKWGKSAFRAGLPRSFFHSVSPVSVLGQQPIFTEALCFIQITTDTGKQMPLQRAERVGDLLLTIFAANRRPPLLSGHQKRCFHDQTSVRKFCSGAFPERNETNFITPFKSFQLVDWPKIAPKIRAK
jgi:hypothetical protein